MSKHVLLQISDVPKENCPIREAYDELVAKYGRAEEYWDLRECFYCINFKGVESLHPEPTIYLHCSETPAKDREETQQWDGGRIRVVVQ